MLRDGQPRWASYAFSDTTRVHSRLAAACWLTARQYKYKLPFDTIDIDTPFGVGYLLGVRFHWWG